MNFVGIDIGSTATKVEVLGDAPLFFVLPTGWNSKDAARIAADRLLGHGIDVEGEETVVVATGYGRICASYADHTITEITCHARGGMEIASADCSIIDVGGQDTKIIETDNGKVVDFLMNDKCSAGTGKFIEVMANRLGVTFPELFELAVRGEIISISSLCTVFAESEIISYIGEGRPKEDIAAGVIDSVASKVAQLAMRKNISGKVILTGGFSDNEYFAKSLSDKMHVCVETTDHGRYAGALGAALLAQEKRNGS